MSLEVILSRLEGVQRNGSGWRALCPAHADKNPSLSINERDGKILVHCHAGCSQEAVCAALKIEARELFPQNGDDGPRRAKRKIVATYDYSDEKGTLLYQKVRYEPKAFCQRRPDGNGGWIGNLQGVRRVLYRLSEVLAARDVLIPEGERDVETTRSLGLCATTGGSAEDPWLEEYTTALARKDVAIIADSDAPGRKKALIIAHALHGRAASVRLLEMPGAKDLSEWVERGGTKDALLELIRNTPEWTPEIVDGARLLDQIAAYIRRFVSLSESQTRVAAVWTAHTHAFDAADATPYLAITSAEKQSGKSRLLEVLDLVVENPWFTGKVTAAVLIRKIDTDQPTLLLDESDTAFGGEQEYAETLRGVLNTGHRRGGTASCCVGQGANITFKDFSTFCPKVIAGIGKLPDTVADRAIPIRLKRAARGEKVERFRRRDVEREAAWLKAQIGAWCGGITSMLRAARPQLPEELTDRQQDGAEPLLAIADLAGGEWHQATRRALVELCSEAQAADSSIGVQLLTDIRDVFESKGVDRLSSVDLATALAEIETSPWSEWSHGKPLSPGKLARLLKPFEVSPETVRLGDKTPRGYLVEQFQEAFRRYLRAETSSSQYNAPQSATVQQTAGSPSVFNDLASDSGDFLKCNNENEVAAQKREKLNENVVCCAVALSNPPTGTGKRGIEEEL
jgi:5S rRNA maturation endonuclease (ribonuclease M5)